jgi:hypothetical protein
MVPDTGARRSSYVELSNDLSEKGGEECIETAYEQKYSIPLSCTDLLKLKGYETQS